MQQSGRGQRGVSCAILESGIKIEGEKAALVLLSSPSSGFHDSSVRYFSCNWLVNSVELEEILGYKWKPVSVRKAVILETIATIR
jgi:hypothetical protein